MSALYRFTGEYIDYDPTGHYNERWDRAKPVSVIAATRDEAFTKLWAMLGTAPVRRAWKAQWNRIDEEPAPV